MEEPGSKNLSPVRPTETWAKPLHQERWSMTDVALLGKAHRLARPGHDGLADARSANEATLTPQGKRRSSSPERSCLVRAFILLIAVGLFRLPGRAQGHATGSSRPSSQGVPSGADARIAAAQDILRKGDRSQGVATLEKQVKISPGVAELHANLAAAYYSVGRFGDAAQQARDALKLKPSLTNAHLFLGLSLAQCGRCEEAQSYLAKDYPRVANPRVKRVVGIESLRCAIDRNDPDKALDLVRPLKRDFPDDPDVLYLSSHAYSQLSTRASQRLLMSAPGSYQAHQLNAESLEIEGRLDEAAAEYRKILARSPNVAGIHYRLGELLLAGERGPSTLNDARREFQEELKIDPRNAAAEYEIAEMARQARQWNDAIEHFKRAASLDPQFAEALVGLGKSLVSAGRPQDAVAPLERAAELKPSDANVHYQLSFAYRRLGREREAATQLSLYREAHDRLEKSKLLIRAGMAGNIAQPQTDTPPE